MEPRWSLCLRISSHSFSFKQNPQTGYPGIWRLIPSQEVWVMRGEFRFHRGHTSSVIVSVQCGAGLFLRGSVTIEGKHLAREQSLFSHSVPQPRDQRSQGYWRPRSLPNRRRRLIGHVLFRSRSRTCHTSDDTCGGGFAVVELSPSTLPGRTAWPLVNFNLTRFVDGVHCVVNQ